MLRCSMLEKRSFTYSHSHCFSWLLFSKFTIEHSRKAMRMTVCTCWTSQSQMAFKIFLHSFFNCLFAIFPINYRLSTFIIFQMEHLEVTKIRLTNKVKEISRAMCSSVGQWCCIVKVKCSSVCTLSVFIATHTSLTPYAYILSVITNIRWTCPKRVLGICC